MVLLLWVWGEYTTRLCNIEEAEVDSVSYRTRTEVPVGRREGRRSKRWCIWRRCWVQEGVE